MPYLSQKYAYMAIGTIVNLFILNLKMLKNHFVKETKQGDKLASRMTNERLQDK